ncbi:MAG: TolC family outer membrane protein [Pseudomonadota bacterium]
MMTLPAAALLVAPAASAQSLADTLVTAFRNSPELLSARADVRIQAELAAQARAGNRPTITGSAGIDLTFDEFNDVTFPTSLALTLSQSLYSGGQVENAISAADTRTTAQQALLVDAEQDVLLDAATAHEDVLRDQQFVELGIKNLRVLSEQLRAARERFEVGEVTRTDVEQARASVASSRSSLAASRGALVASRETYRRVVGVLPGDLRSTTTLPAVPATVEEAIAIALTRDPSLRAARLEREASGFDVRSAIGALLPQLDLIASASRTDTLNPTSSNVVDSDEGSIGVTLTLPFYSGGGNYAAIREQQARAERAISDLTTTERFVIEEVAQAYADLRVAEASIQAGILEVEAAQLAFEGVNEEARVGARTTLDVLDAEADVLDAQTDLVDAERDEIVATYTILAAIGMMTVDHLGLQIDGVDEAAYVETAKQRLFGFDPSEDTVWTRQWRP